MVSEPLDALNARLGKPATDPDRALAAVEDAIVEAATIARRTEWTWTTLPDRVRVIVLHAAMRVYRNPEGLLTRQAGAFSTTQAPGTVPVGWFTNSEESALKSYRPRGGNGLWTLEIERGDLDGDGEYLDPVEDIHGARSKPFPISEDDPDWVPSLNRGIPRQSAPYDRRGWF